MPTIPECITKQIQQRGLSAVIDEVLSREENSRAEMLHWRVIRQGLEAMIPNAILDELSQIAEEAFNELPTN